MTDEPQIAKTSADKIAELSEIIKRQNERDEKLRQIESEQTAKQLITEAQLTARSMLEDAEAKAKGLIDVAVKNAHELLDDATEAAVEVKKTDQDWFVNVSRVPLICQSIIGIHAALEKIEKTISEKYVSKELFTPIQKIVYGLVGLTLATVFGAILALVIIR